jgi:hypothetical protein
LPKSFNPDFTGQISGGLAASERSAAKHDCPACIAMAIDRQSLPRQYGRMKRTRSKPTPPADLKFLEASRFGEFRKPLPYDQSPIAETYATYVENATLAINMGALPGFYMFSAEKWILAQIQTNSDLFGGRPAITPDEKRRAAFREKSYSWKAPILELRL